MSTEQVYNPNAQIPLEAFLNKAQPEMAGKQKKKLLTLQTKKEKEDSVATVLASESREVAAKAKSEAEKAKAEVAKLAVQLEEARAELARLATATTATTATTAPVATAATTAPATPVATQEVPAQPEQTVCKFFAQGNCRNGKKCRFYHPKPQKSTAPVKTTPAKEQTFSPAPDSNPWNVLASASASESEDLAKIMAEQEQQPAPATVPAPAPAPALEFEGTRKQRRVAKAKAAKAKTEADTRVSSNFGICLTEKSKGKCTERGCVFQHTEEEKNRQCAVEDCPTPHNKPRVLCLRANDEVDFSLSPQQVDQAEKVVVLCNKHGFASLKAKKYLH